VLWLWILGGIVLLFALFCLLRLGVLIRIGVPTEVFFTLGPLRIQVAPSKKKKKPQAKKTKKPRRSPRDFLKKLPKFTLEDLKSAWRILWPPARRALARTRRSIRIDPLQLGVTLPGRDDPAAAAALYGKAHGAVWTAMPVLEQLLVIPHPGIHIGLDFDRDRPKAEGSVGISIRIGTLLGLGFGMAIPALRWFLQVKRAHKAAEETPPQEGEPEHPAA
jgi:hypothetical protein